MNNKDLIDLYENLDDKEKIKFDLQFYRIQNKKMCDSQSKRLLFCEMIKNIENENGEPYLSIDFIKNNIIKI
ncbi:hypothetical protein M0Q50_04495 [bacterium]|jgi:hypothetical protein|nr:hypothetical protein [bacterium]